MRRPHARDARRGRSTTGAMTLNDLKTATRCGMGPCGGRLCEDAAARLHCRSARGAHARSRRPGHRTPAAAAGRARPARGRVRLRGAADRRAGAPVSCDDRLRSRRRRRRHHGRHRRAARRAGRHARDRARARCGGLGRLGRERRARCRCRSSACGSCRTRCAATRGGAPRATRSASSGPAATRSRSTTREAALLDERMTLKRDAGAPIEMVSPAQVREREPALSDRIVAASYCAEDGHADSTRTGALPARAAARARASSCVEHAPVHAIDAGDGGFRVHDARADVSPAKRHADRQRRVDARRRGAARRRAADRGARQHGQRHRDRTRASFRRHRPRDRTPDAQAEGERQLSSSAAAGRGADRPRRGAAKSPPTRCCRTCGSRATPCPPSRARASSAAGPGSRRSSPTTIRWPARCPACANAFVLACVRGGYTIGPCIGPLVADLILGREPALPLFDPGARRCPRSGVSEARAARDSRRAGARLAR